MAVDWQFLHRVVVAFVVETPQSICLSDWAPWIMFFENQIGKLGKLNWAANRSSTRAVNLSVMY